MAAGPGAAIVGMGAAVTNRQALGVGEVVTSDSVTMVCGLITLACLVVVGALVEYLWYCKAHGGEA
jgi:hypothetical protein